MKSNYSNNKKKNTLHKITTRKATNQNKKKQKKRSKQGKQVETTSRAIKRETENVTKIPETGRVTKALPKRKQQ